MTPTQSDALDGMSFKDAMRVDHQGNLIFDLSALVHLPGGRERLLELSRMGGKKKDDAALKGVIEGHALIIQKLEAREKELLACIADAALCILTDPENSISDTIWYSGGETLYDFLRFSLPDPDGGWSDLPENQADQLRAIIEQANAAREE